MNYREKMREYLKEPNAFSFQYGKWGILNREQRTLIRRLLNEMDNADAIIRSQIDEIEKLNNRINKAIEFIELNTKTIKVNNVNFPYTLTELYLSTAEREKLLNILKGEE